MCMSVHVHTWVGGGRQHAGGQLHLSDCLLALCVLDRARQGNREIDLNTFPSYKLCHIVVFSGLDKRDFETLELVTWTFLKSLHIYTLIVDI